MAENPIVVVGRRLPEAVNTRLSRDYQPRFNSDDHVYDGAEILALCQDADALLPCHSEHLSAEVIGALPARLKIIANLQRRSPCSCSWGRPGGPAKATAWCVAATGEAGARTSWSAPR
jgi:hypothetical protein